MLFAFSIVYLFTFHSLPVVQMTAAITTQICYACIGTHPGCGLNTFSYKWHYGKTCTRTDDRCVKLIGKQIKNGYNLGQLSCDKTHSFISEKRGSDILVTRDCLSNFEGHRVDIPADKYEGCRPATKDAKLGQHSFNRIKELDTKRYVVDSSFSHATFYFISGLFCSFQGLL